MIKEALLPTPTAFCQCLIWIDAGVSVQNPQLPSALQTHFYHSEREVTLSSRAHLFCCVSGPCAAFWRFCLAAGASAENLREQDVSSLCATKKESTSNADCLQQRRTPSLMNRPRSLVTVYSASCCDSLIPLCMAFCLQLQTKEF